MQYGHAGMCTRSSSCPVAAQHPCTVTCENCPTNQTEDGVCLVRGAVELFAAVDSSSPCSPAVTGLCCESRVSLVLGDGVLDCWFWKGQSHMKGRNSRITQFTKRIKHTQQPPPQPHSTSATRHTKCTLLRPSASSSTVPRDGVYSADRVIVMA